MLSVVNDNKLGSHVVRVNVPVEPIKIDSPPHQTKQFKDRHDYVPNFHKQAPLAYNPGEKSKPSNQYTNNYQKTTTKIEPTTKESGIHSWFRL